MVYQFHCPHPNCPITFKSKRGRTYHIRTVHFNHPINVQHGQERREDDNHHWQDQEYEGHDHQSADGPDDTHSTHWHSGGSVSLVNDQDPVGPGQRKEHPHLTGTWALYVMRLH